MNPLHLFGICVPHSWGHWYFWNGSDYTATPTAGRKKRWCDHCNAVDQRG